MNYYEHHIGDYAEATAHLSFVEDAAYSRLIRKYYATEKPLPADIKTVQRLVGARTKEEKKSVEVVLSEFFFLGDDGWHNSRCDAEIASYRDGEPEREVKKANETNRLKRHREERAELFKRLTDAGLHATWNIGMQELRDTVKRISENAAAQPETAPATQPETAPATLATATQSPDTRHQYVNPTSKSVSSTTQPGEARQLPASTRKGAVCGMLRKSGMADAAPHYLDDQTWESILSKRTDEEIVELAMAKMAARPGQRTGLKYIAQALLDDPIRVSPNARASPENRRLTLTETRAETIAAMTGKNLKNERTSPEERDITSESLRIA
jgi:uncharacterized protein YdaU (DUF1376 family)